jgi:hypothetical protein
MRARALDVLCTVLAGRPDLLHVGAVQVQASEGCEAAKDCSSGHLLQHRCRREAVACNTSGVLSCAVRKHGPQQCAAFWLCGRKLMPAGHRPRLLHCTGEVGYPRLTGTEPKPVEQVR